MCPSLSRLLEHTGTTLGVVVLFGIGLYQGAKTETLTLDLFLVTVRFVFLEALSAVLVFTLFLLVTGALLVHEVWTTRDPDARLTTGPSLSAIVPVYRDHDVLVISVESLLESEYENLTVTVVTEPNDEETLAVARELAARYDRVECLINGTPGSKAGAINHAVDVSDAEYFAVFDADEWIAPEFLPRAMGELQSGSDVFQGRRVPRPTGPVETLAYCERVVFHASYKMVELFGFSNCRSSSTAFTREAFDRVGGYRDLLTEDLDFAHACYREGLAVTQARGCTNTMEAPHTLGDLWGQRKRWRVGQVELLHATIGDLLRGRLGRRGLVSIGRMCSSLLGCLLILAIVSKIVLLLVLNVESTFLVPATILLATIGAVAIKDARDGRIDGLSWTVVLVPVFYPGFGVLTLKSLLEYCLSWDGEWYRVHKSGA
ncbi:glycosyltransferase [Halomontanus rarus]|uniref:glycosyltransferase n=1 Tax=Halomontanus rarus TaxID=3034020 RepID=UPI001A983D59